MEYSRRRTKYRRINGRALIEQTQAPIRVVEMVEGRCKFLIKITVVAVLMHINGGQANLMAEETTTHSIPNCVGTNVHSIVRTYFHYLLIIIQTLYCLQDHTCCSHALMESLESDGNWRRRTLALNITISG